MLSEISLVAIVMLAGHPAAPAICFSKWKFFVTLFIRPLQIHLASSVFARIALTGHDANFRCSKRNVHRSAQIAKLASREIAPSFA